MADILEEIVAHKRIEIEAFKRLLPMKEITRQTETIADSSVPSMQKTLRESETGIIAEFKRRSPSKGWIKQDGQPRQIPLAYQKNGAAAISILTDTQYFGGFDDYIIKARRSGVTIPVLYKNFVIDEYQLFQARLCGASAVLLIAAALNKEMCKTLLYEAHQLKLEVLLEMHDETELDYAELEPDMYGINNRHLGTFVTDVGTSFRLSEMLPNGSCKVSESGISNPETVKALRDIGFRGFLIGEHFMKANDPGEELKQFIERL